MNDIRTAASISLLVALAACSAPASEQTAVSATVDERLDAVSSAAVDVGWTPLYRQDDPAWAHDPYVFDADWWLGYVGCTVTAMSTAAAWVTGQWWSPSWTNASTANYFTTLHTLTPFIRHLGAGLRFLDETQTSARGIAAGSTEHRALVVELLAALRRGNPVVVGMTFSRPIGAVGWTRHTVLATGIDADGWIVIDDPATGTLHALRDYSTMPEFSGYDLADEIAYY